VRDQIEPAIRRVAGGACSACGAEMKMRYERRYPPTINSCREAEVAATAAASLVGDDNVKRDMLPNMAAEDFALFLEKKPGTYIWIGNGDAGGAAMLHNPHYDFNDAILPLGAAIGCGSLNRCCRRMVPRSGNPDLRSLLSILTALGCSSCLNA
jgi:hippurate hydrolase